MELNVGVICACLPSLKTIFQHHYPRASDSNPHFTTPYLHIPHLPSTDVADQFRPNRDHTSAGNSVRLNTFRGGPLNTTEARDQDGSSSNSLTICSVQLPDKALMVGQNWEHDFPWNWRSRKLAIRECRYCIVGCIFLVTEFSGTHNVWLVNMPPDERQRGGG